MTDPSAPAPAPGFRLFTMLKRWRNTVFSALDHLWLLLLWAGSTPVFISTLGKDVFGVWILINALIGLGGVMSFGFGEATIRYVAHYRAREETDNVRRIVESSALMYSATSLVFSIGIWASSAWIAETVFDLTGTAAEPAITGLHLAAVALLVTAFLKTYEAVINGCERFDVTARIGMVTRSFIILSNVVMALMGFGLPALLGVALIGLTGQTIVLYVIARRRFVPGLRLMGWADPVLSGQILRFGLQSWLQICAGAMSNIVDRFIVGALIDPAAAGIYTVCVQLAQQTHLLLYRGLAWLMPASSRDSATGPDPEALLKGYRSGVTLSLLMVAAFSMPLFVLAPQILTIWVGEEFAARGTGVLELLIVYFALWCLGTPGFFVINGAGHPGWNSIANLLHGVIILAMAALLLPGDGLDGIGYARLMAVPTMLITFFALHRYALEGHGASATLGFVAKLGAIFVVTAALHAFVADAIPARILPVILCATGLSATGMALVLGPIWLSRRFSGAARSEV